MSWNEVGKYVNTNGHFSTFFCWNNLYLIGKYYVSAVYISLYKKEGGKKQKLGSNCRTKNRSQKQSTFLF